jgi:hypothetical protein
MRKKINFQTLTFLFICLLLAGCQKSTDVSPENLLLKKPTDGNLKNQCQLVYAEDIGNFPNWYFYNDKGLAEEWRIDFGTGIPDIITMTYDSDNKLKNAEWHSNGNLFATIDFDWDGKQLTEEHWNIGGGLFDVINTYNSKGEIVKREGTDGYVANYTYTPQGNHAQDFVYFQGQLLQSDEFTYKQPNKYPNLAITGIPYSFIFVNPYMSKWYHESNRFTVYDAGNPIILLDTDPAQTIMQIGAQNYLNSITFFDNINGSHVTRSFEYQNCGSDKNNAISRANPSSENSILKKKRTNVFQHSLKRTKSVK